MRGLVLLLNAVKPKNGFAINSRAANANTILSVIFWGIVVLTTSELQK
jgi:hypothetical protein